MAVSDVDLAWLESIELPSLSWAEWRAYRDVQWDKTRTPSARFDAIDAIRLRLDAIQFGGDGTGRLDWACGDTALPIEHRERIARVFFRIAAWDAIAGNELDEGQKAWAITQLKKKSQAADRILAIWIASADPHAALVRALRDTWPEASAIEIARVVERICSGWGFAAPDRLSKAELKTVVKHFAELARMPAVVDAVVQWLPALGDFERRVLHAGAVLASEGSERCATALGPVLAEAEHREASTGRTWVAAIWSRLAPKGSPVAAMLR